MNDKPSTSPKKRPVIDQPLAAILQRRRESLEISLPDAEQATRIRGKYIEAIESGDYDTLKDDVYARGYVRNYADYLGLDPKPILKMYDSERAGQREMKRQSKHRASQHRTQIGLRPLRRTRWVITPRTFVVLSVLSVMAVVVIYIIWQVVILSAPPKLVISNAESRMVTGSFGYVSGDVENGSDLYIDDSPVLVAADGSFRERIALSDGRNEIHLEAKNRLGKVADQTYVITARIAPTPSVSPPAISGDTTAPSPSPTPYDGVQIVVTVDDTATWLIVQADGKEIFRGTMLTGSTQTFSAADSLTLSTGNAGKTHVTLTNPVVTSKDLGPVGPVGQTQRDVQYNRDTLR